MVKLFAETLGYGYLGGLSTRIDKRSEEGLLRTFPRDRQGCDLHHTKVIA